MINSRKEVLDALRGVSIADTPLPQLDGNWTTYADPKDQFCKIMVAGGGHVLEVSGPENIEAALGQVDVFRDATKIWSLVPGVASRGGDWGAVTDPHEFEALECCVAPGEFAVAENGAVWITDAAVPQRAALFVTQHLLLTVPADMLVQNMHEAYARISFQDARFGIFISGPSKTADIEQSLVIGAHGARSLTVLLVSGNQP